MTEQDPSFFDLSHRNFIPVNRQDRRHVRKVTMPEAVAGKGITSSYEKFNTAELKRVEIIKNSSSPDFQHLLYAEPPYALNVLNNMRNFATALSQGKDHGVEEDFLTKYGAYNFFARNTRGLSLLDIEHMPLPLEPEDIRKIDRLFVHNIAHVLKGHDKYAVELMILSATQPLVRPELTVPRVVSPLVKRLQNYFDYYLPYALSPKLENDDEVEYTTITNWLGNNFLTALGAYIPARLGLTPASVFKLYHEQSDRTTDWISKVLRNNITKRLEEGSAHAHRDGALPKELESYQFYDKDKDDKAVKYLTTLGQNVNPEIVENIWDKLNLYRETIKRDISKSKDGFLTFEMHDDDSPVQKILVTSQYPQTLMFILTLTDNTHLTLESSKGFSLFGLPYALTKEYPHFDDIAALKFIRPVLEETIKKHDQKPVEIITKIREESVAPLKTGVTQTPIDFEDEESSSQKVKIKTRPALLAMVVGEPEEVLSEKDFEPTRRVVTINYDRESVAKLMGIKKPNKEVDRVMKDLRKIEYGQKSYKPLTDYDDLCSARSGDRRIILTQISNHSLDLEDILNRGVSYNPRRLGAIS